MYHTHDGRQGWVTTTTQWSMNGSNMNGIPGPWPPAEEPTVYVMGASDWPDVEWPMALYVNASNGTMVPTSDKWTGEGDWGQYWLGTGGTCADRTPAVGYWCAPNAPRGISPANHPGGIYAEAVRGIRYKDPRGAIIHSWMPYHWYTYMFEVRDSKFVPGTARPARSFPGTNGIWGKCSAPSTCQEGIAFLANFSTLQACTAAVAARGMQSYTWFHPTFPQKDYASRCYGLMTTLIDPRPQGNVDSGSAAYPGDSLLEFSRGGFQGGEGIMPNGGNLNTSNWYVAPSPS